VSQPTDIQLIVFDCDGVLTDGSLIYNDQGVETKQFHVRDGFGFRAAMAANMKVGVLTARSSRALTQRMVELKVDLYMHGQTNKAEAIEALVQQAQVKLEQTAYLGDDVLDLPALTRVGYPMAVADAVEEVRTAARFTTTAPGGHGAAREAIEHILKAQDKWARIIEQFGQ
jgi:3-deoxy-D-manno-octulosonate 8-phosphate phosphatase (KDO 8-P phosphatase)